MCHRRFSGLVSARDVPHRVDGDRRLHLCVVSDSRGDTWHCPGLVRARVGDLARLLGASRPPLPRLRAALDAFGDALRDRAVLVAAAAPIIGIVYAVALAVGTPEDEGDALAYHVPRAAFWDQHQGVSYIAHAVDVRLNVNPTFGEVGVLFTMLASGTQRFVGLVQIGAFVACALSVAGLARRLGFGTQASVFGAVVFAGFPVVVTQSWTAQNDLVVASFLAAAAYFVLGDGRPDAVLGGLAIGLAVGTKFTAIFLLPLLALLIWLGRRGRPRARVAVLAALGAAVGAFWYVVNLWETHGSPAASRKARRRTIRSPRS